MFANGLIDGIVKEPIGGAHAAPEEMAKTLKQQIQQSLSELIGMDPDARIAARIEKYARMGEYEVAKKKGEA